MRKPTKPTFVSLVVAVSLSTWAACSSKESGSASTSDAESAGSGGTGSAGGTTSSGTTRGTTTSTASGTSGSNASGAGGTGGTGGASATATTGNVPTTGVGGSAGSPSTLGWDAPLEIATSFSADYGYPTVVMGRDGAGMMMFSRDRELTASRVTLGSQTIGESTALSDAGYDAVLADFSIATSGHGDIVAIFSYDDNSVWVRQFYADNGSWGQSIQLDTDLEHAAYGLQIAVSDDGSAMAAWEQSDGTINSVWAAHRSTGGAWSPPDVIEMDDSSAHNGPVLGMDASGNAHVVWSNYGAQQLWTNRYDALTGSWGEAEVFVADNPTLALSVHPDGSAVAVYPTSDNTGLMARRFDVEADIWGDPVSLISYETYTVVAPSAAMDDNGDIAVVFLRESEDEATKAMATRYAADSDEWDSPSTLRLSDNAQDVQIQMAPGGDATVVVTRLFGDWLTLWDYGSSAKTEVWAYHYSIGSDEWGTASLVGPADGDQRRIAMGPSVGIGASGDAFIAFQQWEYDVGESIWGAFYSP